MIHHLDETIRAFLTREAPAGSALSGATIDFSAPNQEWQAELQPGLTLNCYLYDVRENLGLKRVDAIVERTDTSTGVRAVRRQPPGRIDCRYCITAWSVIADSSPASSVSDEHWLLSDVLRVLLQHRTVPAAYWRDSPLGQQLPPYPMVVAEPDALKSQPEYWVAFNQQPRPSLTYLVTITMPLDTREATTAVVGEPRVSIDEPLGAPIRRDRLAGSAS